MVFFLGIFAVSFMKWKRRRLDVEPQPRRFITSTACGDYAHTRQPEFCARQMLIARTRPVTN